MMQAQQTLQLAQAQAQAQQVAAAQQLLVQQQQQQLAAVHHHHQQQQQQQQQTAGECGWHWGGLMGAHCAVHCIYGTCCTYVRTYVPRYVRTCILIHMYIDSTCAYVGCCCIGCVHLGWYLLLTYVRTYLSRFILVVA